MVSTGGCGGTRPVWTRARGLRLILAEARHAKGGDRTMMPLILWLLGVPLSLIIVLWLLGVFS
jgi:hypothetical protein